MNKKLILSILLLNLSLMLKSQTVCDFFTVASSSVQASDGQIDLRIISGNAPYTIYWSSGIHQENQTGLMAGTYTCTIVDALQTASIFSTEVKAPESFNWSYENTGDNHTILIMEDNVVNIPFDTGDVLGVFYTDNGSLKCGGYAVWESGNFAISAWGDSGFTPEKDGFINDEPFIFAYYDQATQRTSFLQSDFIIGTFPNEGRYSSNGMSGVAQVGNISQELSSKLPGKQEDYAQIYPNPFLDIIHIKLADFDSSPKKIAILSSDGRIINQYESNQSESISIQTDELSSGFYFLRINNYPLIPLIKAN